MYTPAIHYNCVEDTTGSIKASIPFTCIYDVPAAWWGPVYGLHPRFGGFGVTGAGSRGEDSTVGFSDSIHDLRSGLLYYKL